MVLRSFRQWIGLICELAKVRITIVSTVTTAVGYLMYRRGIDAGIIAPLLGLFILACGSAVLNQYQEYGTDAGMDRTRSRPIPSGAISPNGALQLAVLFITVGLLILFLATTFTAALLGVLALVWYNGVYLFLKRRSAFAVVPGALIGAIPPAVGWVSAGGELQDPTILSVSFFFFIWQIPHFWLLLLKYGKQYESIGYPSLTQKLTMVQIGRLIFTWTVATAVTGMMMALWAGMTSRVTLVGLLLAGIVLVARLRRLLVLAEKPILVMQAFMTINVYALVVSIIITADRIIAGS